MWNIFLLLAKLFLNIVLLVLVNAKPSITNEINVIDIKEPVKVKAHLAHEHVEVNQSIRY